MRLSKTAKLEAEITRLRAMVEPDPQIEIVRSFSFKLNHGAHGGLQYESSDYFESRKTSCKVSQSDATGDLLYSGCRSAVLKSVRETVARLRDGSWKNEAYERAERPSVLPSALDTERKVDEVRREILEKRNHGAY